MLNFPKLIPADPYSFIQGICLYQRGCPENPCRVQRRRNLIKFGFARFTAVLIDARVLVLLMIRPYGEDP